MAWRRLLRAAVLAAGWLVLALTAARADVLDLNYARAMLLPEGRAYWLLTATPGPPGSIAPPIAAEDRSVHALESDTCG